jgi:hypothetical protein
VTAPDLVVRARAADDLPPLLAVLARSHARDRSPRRREVVRADWLATAGGRAAVDAGRTPVLLVDPVADARTVYARLGWQEIGTARPHWGQHEVDAVLMVPRGGD